jgi:hypothetical protein
MEKIILIIGVAAIILFDPTHTFVKLDQEILIRLFN